MSTEDTNSEVETNGVTSLHDFTEGMKLYHDTFKQLTTLTTGSILLVATFLNSLFTNPQGRVLITLAFFCFITSTLSSVFLMVLFADELRGVGPYTVLPPGSKVRRMYFRYHETAVNLRVLAMGISVLSFVLGIAALATFAAINFQ